MNGREVRGMEHDPWDDTGLWFDVRLDHEQTERFYATQAGYGYARPWWRRHSRPLAVLAGIAVVAVPALVWH